MSHVYVMPDGNTLFISVAPGSPAPTQEAMEAYYLRSKAEDAARDPAAIAYGKLLRQGALNRGLMMRDIQDATGIRAADLSKVYHGRRFATPAELAAIRELFARTPLEVTPEPPAWALAELRRMGWGGGA